MGPTGRRGEKDQRQNRAVEKHKRDGYGYLAKRRKAADGVLHDKLAHAPDALQAALEVSGPAYVEILHRQSQELAHEKIERSGSG